jgi:hypothetical protein
MVDVFMKMKFSINKYSQVFSTVGPGYGGLAKFILGFPGGYNFRFTGVEISRGWFLISSAKSK